MSAMSDSMLADPQQIMTFDASSVSAEPSWTKRNGT
jgi:hypothetical protein